MEIITVEIFGETIDGAEIVARRSADQQMDGRQLAEAFGRQFADASDVAQQSGNAAQTSPRHRCRRFQHLRRVVHFHLDTQLPQRHQT